MNIMEIVLQYIPDNIIFELGGLKDTNTFLDVSGMMRDFITKYGTDEWMLGPEEAFNQMCVAIVKGYGIDEEIDENYNPYDNLVDLAQVFPTVVEHADVDFVIRCTMFSDEPVYDVHEHMREYVQRNALDLLVKLETR